MNREKLKADTIKGNIYKFCPDKKDIIEPIADRKFPDDNAVYVKEDAMPILKELEDEVNEILSSSQRTENTSDDTTASKDSRNGQPSIDN